MKRRLSFINEYGEKKRIVITGDLTIVNSYPTKTGNYITSFNGYEYTIERYREGTNSWVKKGIFFR